MNEKDILNALGSIDPDYIEDSAPSEKGRRKTPMKIRIIAAVVCVSLIIAAIVAAFVVPKIMEKGEGGILPSEPYNKYVLAIAKYPEISISAPNKEKYSDDSAYLRVYSAWQESIKTQTALKTDVDNLDPFFELSAKALLTAEDDENAVYSPLSLYMTLAMLGEVTEGETRAQILELLGVDSVEALRTQACAIWKHTYIDDGANKSFLANSLWLSDKLSSNEQTVNTLAEKYYASSYKGDFTDEGFISEYCKWINENTGNLFDVSPDSLSLDEQTALSIVSALDFYANWERQSNFFLKKVESGTFHAAGGDVTAEFMTYKGDRVMFGAENFYAVNLPLQSGGMMWFVLPLEDSSVNDVIADEYFMSFITGNAERECKKYEMTLSVPKFDVANEKKIDEELKELGIDKAFDPFLADFSAISDSEQVYISDVIHGAKVKIDEKGVVGGAYVQAPNAFLTGLPDGNKIELTFDRPFVFAVTTAENLPLFVGVVNDPTK